MQFPFGREVQGLLLPPSRREGLGFAAMADLQAAGREASSCTSPQRGDGYVARLDRVPWAFAGTIVHFRKLSRKIFFFDLRLHPPLCAAGEGMSAMLIDFEASLSSMAVETPLIASSLGIDSVAFEGGGKIEVVLKHPLCADVKKYSSRLHLGDKVLARGQHLEKVNDMKRNHVVFHAFEVIVLVNIKQTSCRFPAVERPQMHESIASRQEHSALCSSPNSEPQTENCMADGNCTSQEECAGLDLMKITSKVESAAGVDSGQKTHTVEVEGLAAGCEAQPVEEARVAAVTLFEEIDWRKACKYWINTRSCSNGALCPYEHPTGRIYELTRKAWVANRIERRRVQFAEKEDPFDPHAKARKGLRALVFAEWLMGTFSAALLSSGEGVLDIAGGRGSLSFALHVIHSVTTTLVDPRLRKLSRFEHRYLASHPEASLPSVVQDEFDLDKPQWRSMVRSSSCLVGLHPDEATELIVKAAVEFRKPFAVVPCCVFPALFPERKIVLGGSQQSVESYEQFVVYLKALAEAGGAHVNIGWLNIEGKNQVVYCKSYY